MSDAIDNTQTVERGVASNIVARAQVLQRGAEQSAVFTAVLTAAILLLVMIATFAVARSLVLPLRKLRAGALDIATVQLPERVRQLAEATDPATSLEVAPIDVLSTDEIGQVARAFDQVHAEAVRLAGNEAMLRSSFNAMFVNLSRRSQALIERLVRTIDSLEQNEEDPDRLSYLFAMDHLVTRMRRNSENLLLLAGHDSARKWSEPVSLADVARAATSEIEQYSRVATEHSARDLGLRAGGIRRRAPARRDHRERHHLLPQGHPGARVSPGTDQRGRADRGQRQRGRHFRRPAGGDEPAADQSAGNRRIGIPAHGALRRSAAGRTTRGAGSAAGRIPAGADRSGMAAGQPHRAGNPPVRRIRRNRVPLLKPTSRRPGGQPVVTAWPCARLRMARPRTTTGWMSSARPGKSARARARRCRRTRRRRAGSTTVGRPQRIRPAAATCHPVQTGGLKAKTGGLKAKTGGLKASMPPRSSPIRSVASDTAAGLPVRVPRANLLPGSAGGGRQADSRVTSRPADGYQAQTSAALRPPRSPELARSRLSGFQRGARRAEGQTPRTAEGADR